MADSQADCNQHDLRCDKLMAYHVVTQWSCSPFGVIEFLLSQFIPLLFDRGLVLRMVQGLLESL